MFHHENIHLLREEVFVQLLGGSGGGQHLPVDGDSRQVGHGHVLHLVWPGVDKLVLVLPDGQAVLPVPPVCCRPPLRSTGRQRESDLLVTS